MEYETECLRLLADVAAAAIAAILSVKEAHDNKTLPHAEETESELLCLFHSPRPRERAVRSGAPGELLASLFIECSEFN